MKQLSLFDFLAFALPGGSFIIIANAILVSQEIILFHTELSSEEKAIPFFVLSYILGHVLSLLSKPLDKLFFMKNKAWMNFLSKNDKDAKKINEECKSLFNEEFIDDSTNIIDTEKSGRLFDKIFDYLESENKLEKVKVLMAQFAFFRNTTPLWIAIFFMCISLAVIQYFSHIKLPTSESGFLLYSLIPLLLAIISFCLLIKRKLLMMSHVYRIFLAIKTN